MKEKTAIEKMVDELEAELASHEDRYGRELTRHHIERARRLASLEAKPPANAELVEALADLEHRRWASWQKYVHNLSPLNEKGERVIPASSVEHWERQIVTKYKDLTEYEKGMDRKEVYKTLEVLSKYRPVPVVKEQGEVGIKKEERCNLCQDKNGAYYCSYCLTHGRHDYYRPSTPAPVASGLSEEIKNVCNHFHKEAYNFYQAQKNTDFELIARAAFNMIVGVEENIDEILSRYSKEAK